jgi:hypothetical protein
LVWSASAALLLLVALEVAFGPLAARSPLFAVITGILGMVVVWGVAFAVPRPRKPVVLPPDPIPGEAIVSAIDRCIMAVISLAFMLAGLVAFIWLVKRIWEAV